MPDYSLTDFIPIKGIVQRDNGKEYLVVRSPMDAEGNDCSVCAFAKKSGLCFFIKCSAASREDGHDVIFLRIREVKG